MFFKMRGLFSVISHRRAKLDMRDDWETSSSFKKHLSLFYCYFVFIIKGSKIYHTRSDHVKHYRMKIGSVNLLSMCKCWVLSIFHQLKFNNSILWKFEKLSISDELKLILFSFAQTQFVWLSYHGNIMAWWNVIIYI
jgi:hypothetical protein